MNEPLNPPKVILLHKDLYTRIIRNNLNIVDVMSYDKIRPFLSLDDIAEWRYLNDIYTVNGNSLAFCSLFQTNTFLYNNYNPKYNSEIISSIMPMSESDTIKNSCLSKLNTHLLEPKPYTFLLIGEANTLFIILDNGFNDFITNKDLSLRERILEFYREYIKNCYNMMPQHQVPIMSFYNSYLKLITERSS